MDQLTSISNLAGLIAMRDPELSARVVALHFAGRDLTYAELAKRAQELAMRLRRSGVEFGDRILIPMPNSVEFVVSLYAVWWLGAVAVPMNHTLSTREIEMGIEDVSPVAALEMADPSPAMDRVAWSGQRIAVPARFDSDADVGVDLPAEVSPDHGAAIIFTSGTTGRPKGAALSHGALHDANHAIGRALKGEQGPYPLTDRPRSPTLIALPLAHTGGLCSTLFAHYAGRQALLLDRFRIESFVNTIHKRNVDTVVVTPTMIQMLASYRASIDLGPVKIVQSTGAPLQSVIKRRFEERFGLPIIQNYGQTEALHVAGWTREELVNGTWRAGSVGRPYPGVELRILDDEGRDVGVGEPGEIVVRSRHNMSSYVGEAARSDSSINDEGWLHTGDLGYLDSDGYLYLVDRKKEVIIVGGFNVYPAEIEGVLLEHPDVADVAVVGLPDERLGEVPHAFVVPADVGDVEEDELIQYCRDAVAHYKSIRGVTLVDELPRTQSQKTKRQQIREMALSKMRTEVE